MTRPHMWTLAGLELVTHNLPKSGFFFETFADGVDLGQPGGERVVQESLLLDGDDVSIPHWSNRTLRLRVAVCGYSNTDLHAGAAALHSRLGGPAPLIWTPPGDGPESLYDVRTSSMAFSTERGSDVPFDLQWSRAGVRHDWYDLTLDAAPFPTTVDAVEESFSPGAGTITPQQDGSSAADWPGLSTGTYLSQSVVSQGPVAAVTSGSWAVPDWAVGLPGLIGQGYSQSAAIQDKVRCTDVFPAANYIYMDLALEVTGGGILPSNPALRMAGTPTGRPVGTGTAAHTGFIRYFWPRPTSGLIDMDWVVGAAPGSTATLHIDEAGISTTLPAGSLLGLNSASSVRVRGRLRISHPSPGSNSLGEVLCYGDPSMLQYGWNPALDTTWAQAPEGTYWLYVQPGLVSTGPNVAYSVGDVFSVTLAGQTRSTKTEWAGHTTATSGRWFPLGPFFFGGRLDRRLGSVANLSDEMTLTRNGSPMAFNSLVRLFREDPSTSLVHALGLTVSGADQRSNLFIDPPSFETGRGGVFAGELTDGSDAVAWVDSTTQLPWKQWPVISPGTTPMFLQASGTTTPTLTALHRPAGHTFAPLVA